MNYTYNGEVIGGHGVITTSLGICQVEDGRYTSKSNKRYETHQVLLMPWKVTHGQPECSSFA